MIVYVCVISDFGREVGELCVLGYYAACSGKFLTDVSGQPIGSFFQVQEMSVRNYRHTRRNTPEECIPRCCISLTKHDPCVYFVMMVTCMVRNMLQ